MKNYTLSLALAAMALTSSVPAAAAVVYQSVTDMSVGNVQALYCSQCSYDLSKVQDQFTLSADTAITGINLWIYASGGYDSVEDSGYNLEIWDDTQSNLVFSQRIYPLSVITSRAGTLSTEHLVGGTISGLTLEAGTYWAKFFTDLSDGDDQMAILGFGGGNGSYTGSDVGFGGTKTRNAGYQLLGPDSEPNGENGTGESPTPEPASWAMMVGGFGLIGAAMRRRRTTVTFA